MKIIIGSSEVCGMIHDLGKEWERQEHDVLTISGQGNKFYHYKYDLDPDDLIYSFLFLKTKSKKLSRSLSSMASGVSFMKRGIESYIIKRTLNWCDCFVQIYNAGLWEESRQLKYLN